MLPPSFTLKPTVILLLLMAAYINTSAQLNVTMSPNTATLGQTLVTTLTSQTQIFTQGCIITDVSLKKNGGVFTINPNPGTYNYSVATRFRNNGPFHYRRRWVTMISSLQAKALSPTLLQ
jgi:hypothetical protein